MDLVYMPEVFIYGSFRSPQYRDYELSWNKEYLHNNKTAIRKVKPNSVATISSRTNRASNKRDLSLVSRNKKEESSSLHKK